MSSAGAAEPAAALADAHPAAALAEYDVLVVGAGPAGLSAALNLVRARRRVLVVDGGRPRNAATLHAHGFLTRDGISPLELRQLGRAEVETYPDAEFQAGLVSGLTAEGHSRSGGGFLAAIRGMRGLPNRSVRAGAVVIASGLIEEFPALPSIRAFYGTRLHSCIECDGYEERDRALALIGETDDLAEQALLLRQWSANLVVFTNGVGRVTADEEQRLRGVGVALERRPIEDLVGERDVLTGVRLTDGTVIARQAGFIRPRYSLALGYAAELGLATDASGFLAVDPSGRCSVRGVYAAGDAAAPGPQQLIVAAGAGALAAAALLRDSIPR